MPTQRIRHQLPVRQRFFAMVTLAILSLSVVPRAHGECVADPGFSPAVVTPSGAPSSSSTYGTGWTSIGIHVQEDLEIDNNFSITDCTVRVDAGFRIVVRPGFTLTVDQSLITDCDNVMWSTIEVEPGASLILTGGSTVANAEVGVTSVSTTGSPGAFTITESRLENNRVGIDVLPYDGPGAHPGMIENSEVLAPSLKAPYAGDLGFIGLRAQGVWDMVADEGLVVGDPASTVTSGVTTNEWHDLEIGMLFVGSHARVQNNVLRDMITQGAPPSLNRGVGIGAASDGKLFVGSPAGGGPGVNNRIEDCEKGVLAVGLQEVTVEGNEILGSGGADPTMNQGVWVQNNDAAVLVQDNLIREFDSIGVYVRSFNGLVEVLENTVENVAVVSNNSCRIAAVEVRAGLPNANTAVNDNDISGVQFGISLSGLVNTTEALDNRIGFRLPAACAGEFAFGIQAESVEGLLVRDNAITADCPGCTNADIRGVDITESPGFLVDVNTMTDCGVGAAASGPCPGGNFTCNILYDCRYGFGLVGMDGGAADVGPVTDNIALGNGSGNRWFPATTANRTIAVTDPGSGIPTYGTPPSGTPPPFPIEWIFHSSAFGSHYNMFPAAVFNTFSVAPSTAVIPTLILPGVLPCDLAPRLGSGAATELRIQERDNRFRGMAHWLQPDSVGSCRNRAAKRHYHHWMARDTSWLGLGVPSDADYRSAFQALDATSLGHWWRYAEALRAGDSDAAATILSGLTPGCPQDAYLAEVLTIWQRPALADTLILPFRDRLLPYDAVQRLTLEQVAALSPRDGGEAVHLARALLGEWSSTAWGLRQAPPADSDVSRHALHVYPNPLRETVYLESDALQGTLPEAWQACLMDLRGRILACRMPTDGFRLRMPLEDLASGTYLLELRHETGQLLRTQVTVP